MSQKYLVQIDKSNISETKKDVEKMRTSSSVEINKELETDTTKIISITADPATIEETINGLSKKEGVHIEENQTFRVQGTLKVSRFRNFYEWFQSIWKPSHDNLSSSTNNPVPESELGKYALKKNYRFNHDVNRNLWNIQDSRCEIAWNLGYTGQGVRVAVLDTGAEFDHIALMKNLSVNEGLSTVGPGVTSSDFSDRHQHGSHVCGTVAANNAILGYAPEATLIPIKVLGDDGCGDMDDIIEGLIIAGQLQVDVINMSLGGGKYSKILHDIIKELSGKGIVLCVASGNEASDVSYPAKYDEVIPVGSYNKYNKISFFSNHGPDMAKGLVAPGEKIYSCALKNQYRYDNGTSMATPAVAGAAVLIKQIDKQKITPEIVRQALNEGSVDILSVPMEYQGNGKLDVPNALIRANELLLPPVAHVPQPFKQYPRLAPGCKGDLVRRFQIPLQQARLYVSRIDGIYGPGTAKAVSNFTKGKQDFVTTDIWKQLVKTDFPDIFEKSLQITAAYEGTGYTRLVGNFDDGILTFGIIGFTVKYESFQKVLTESCQMYPEKVKQAFGELHPQIFNLTSQYYRNRILGNMAFKKWALSIQSVQNGKHIVQREWREAFENFGSIPEVQEIQRQRAKEEYWTRALEWSEKFGMKEELSLGLLFDCAVQGFNSTGRQQAERLTAAGIKEIITTLQATLEAKGAISEEEKRKIVATANADTCKPEFKQDVWSRKSTFINGLKSGKVHGETFLLGDWGFVV